MDESVYQFLYFLVSWELLYWVSRLAMRSLAARSFFHSQVRRDAPAYIVSTAHAIYAASRGFTHLRVLAQAPPILKNHLPQDVTVFVSSIGEKAALTFVNESRRVVQTNASLAGYLTSDLIRVITSYPNLGKLDTIAHHAVFLFCAFVAGWYRIYPFMFSWLILGEASTPFLNMRWFLIKQGMGDTQLMAIVSILFAGLFFLTRFCMYGAGLVYQTKIMSDFPQDIPDVIPNGTIFVVSLGFILNLVWLSKIVKIAMQPTRPAKATTSDTNSAGFTSTPTSSTLNAESKAKAA